MNLPWWRRWGLSVRDSRGWCRRRWTGTRRCDPWGARCWRPSRCTAPWLLLQAAVGSPASGHRALRHLQDSSLSAGVVCVGQQENCDRARILTSKVLISPPQEARSKLITLGLVVGLVPVCDDTVSQWPNRNLVEKRWLARSWITQALSTTKQEAKHGKVASLVGILKKKKKKCATPPPTVIC